VQKDSSLFHTFLADQPAYLVPERLLHDSTENTGPLVVSTNLWFSWRDSLPPGVASLYPLPQAFFQDAGFIWVDDPVRGVQMPFWAGPWFQKQLDGLQTGQETATWSRQLRSVLWQAGVLVSRRIEEDLSRAWRKQLDEARTKLQSDGHAHLYDLIHPFHLGSLRRYYRCLLRKGGMSYGDNCSPHRWVAYNESVAKFFQRQLTGIVSVVAGVQVKSSFAYVVSYPGGSDLPVHIDREQCEYAISLLVDFTPEPHEQSPWPLYFETAKGTAAVWQALGGAVIYRGREIPHYRKLLAPHCSSTSMLFYFVDDSFDGPLG
jgi:hypothetical protein